MNLISIDPAIRSGEPCLVGRRLTVNDVIEICQSGEADDYDLTREEIEACFNFHKSLNRTCETRMIE